MPVLAGRQVTALLSILTCPSLLCSGVCHLSSSSRVLINPQTLSHNTNSVQALPRAAGCCVERTELMPQQMTPWCRGPGLVATNIDIAFMTMTWSLLNRF